MKKILFGGVFASLSLLPLGAATHTVPAGTTNTLDGVTETDRFVKNGAGTLIVTGTNTFSGLTMTEGTLLFEGGATLISTAPGSGASDSASIFAKSGGTMVIRGGAEVTVSSTTGSGYAITHGSGNLIVTNGTLNIRNIGEFLNAFADNGLTDDVKLVIDAGGVVNAKKLRAAKAGAAWKNRVGVDLNPGGELHVDYLTTDQYKYYGRINLNGGRLFSTTAGNLSQASTHLFSSDSSPSIKSWYEDGVTPTVGTGGFHLVQGNANVIYKRFDSIADVTGEDVRDGGVHISGKSTLYWYPSTSTYNGGTWLESDQGATFVIPDSENGALGVLPAAPETNIWVMGSLHTIFGGTSGIVHSNRQVFVKSGRTLTASSNGALTFAGEIHGEHEGDCPYATNVRFRVSVDDPSWKGRVVLDPGDGHTNDIGRVQVDGQLVVTSGVTVLTSGLVRNTGSSSILYVCGDGSSYGDTRGHLTIAGGELTYYKPVGSATSSGAYVDVRKNAQVDIVGGKVNMPSGVEWLHAINGTAKMTVADGGELNVSVLRVSQSKVTPAPVINLSTGGLIRAGLMKIEKGNTQNSIFNFDGGRFRSAKGNDGRDLFESNTHVNWSGVTFAVCAGGAWFDAVGQHIWWERPLSSGAEHDGGIRKTGDKALVLTTTNTYNGVTRIEQGTLQARVDYAIPRGNTVQLVGGGLACSTYASGYPPTEQVLGRLEGDGTLDFCSKVSITNALAPSIGGALSLEYPVDLNCDLEISGDATGCGRVKFTRTQDISGLTLKIVDADAFDKEADRARYRIIEGEYTGHLTLPAEMPANWWVRYESKGVYLNYQRGTMVIFR